VSALINRGNILADQRKSDAALYDFGEAVSICESFIQNGRQEIAPRLAQRADHESRDTERYGT